MKNALGMVELVFTLVLGLVLFFILYNTHLSENYGVHRQSQLNKQKEIINKEIEKIESIKIENDQRVKMLQEDY